MQDGATESFSLGGVVLLGVGLAPAVGQGVVAAVLGLKSVPGPLDCSDGGFEHPPEERCASMYEWCRPRGQEPSCVVRSVDGKATIVVAHNTTTQNRIRVQDGDGDLVFDRTFSQPVSDVFRGRGEPGDWRISIQGAYGGQQRYELWG